jgi:hypothetical protein
MATTGTARSRDRIRRTRRLVTTKGSDQDGAQTRIRSAATNGRATTTSGRSVARATHERRRSAIGNPDGHDGAHLAVADLAQQRNRDRNARHECSDHHLSTHAPHNTTSLLGEERDGVSEFPMRALQKSPPRPVPPLARKDSTTSLSVAVGHSARFLRGAATAPDPATRLAKCGSARTRPRVTLRRDDPPRGEGIVTRTPLRQVQRKRNGRTRPGSPRETCQFLEPGAIASRYGMDYPSGLSPQFRRRAGAAMQRSAQGNNAAMPPGHIHITDGLHTGARTTSPSVVPAGTERVVTSTDVRSASRSHRPLCDTACREGSRGVRPIDDAPASDSLQVGGIVAVRRVRGKHRLSILQSGPDGSFTEKAPPRTGSVDHARRSPPGVSPGIVASRWGFTIRSVCAHKASSSLLRVSPPPPHLKLDRALTPHRAIPRNATTMHLQLHAAFSRSEMDAGAALSFSLPVRTPRSVVIGGSVK